MQKAQELKPAGVSRRTALKAFGTGIGTVAALPWLSDEGLLAFARIQESNAPPQPKVFSPRSSRPSSFSSTRLFPPTIVLRARSRRASPTTSICWSAKATGGCPWNGSAGSRRSTAKPRRGSARRSPAHGRSGRRHSADHQPQREGAADAARSVLRDGEAGDDSRLLHVEDRHSRRAALQGQSCSSRTSSAARPRTARIARICGQKHVDSEVHDVLAMRTEARSITMFFFENHDILRDHPDLC